jgi:Enoyl-CoA hydratase/isomerase
MAGSSNAAHLRLHRVSAAYWRLVIDNPPLNLMGPDLVLQFRDVMSTLETDEHVKVVVFESAVPGFFLNHSDFNGSLDELTNIPQGPTGLEAWPDVLVRLPRAPVVSIALIRGRATGNGSELALASRIASFDKWAISNTKRRVNAANSVTDVEMAAGWDTCMASIARPAAQARIKSLREIGFHEPGDVENRLGFYLAQLGR